MGTAPPINFQSCTRPLFVDFALHNTSSPRFQSTAPAVLGNTIAKAAQGAGKEGNYMMPSAFSFACVLCFFCGPCVTGTLGVSQKRLCFALRCQSCCRLCTSNFMALGHNTTHDGIPCTGNALLLHHSACCQLYLRLSCSISCPSY